MLLILLVLAVLFRVRKAHTHEVHADAYVVVVSAHAVIVTVAQQQQKHEAAAAAVR